MRFSDVITMVIGMMAEASGTTFEEASLAYNGRDLLCVCIGYEMAQNALLAEEQATSPTEVVPNQEQVAEEIMEYATELESEVE